MFYCHGCGRGGDLIRFVELFLHLSFRQSVAHLEQELETDPTSALLEQSASFYRLQLHRHATCAIGTHLTSAQMAQLGDQRGRSVYIAFDHDENQGGQQAFHRLARDLESAGIRACMVPLPLGHDPNSYFAAGATAADFTVCLERAQQP